MWRHRAEFESSWGLMSPICMVGDIHVGWARSGRLGEVGKIKQGLLEGGICL